MDREKDLEQNNGRVKRSRYMRRNRT